LIHFHLADIFTWFLWQSRVKGCLEVEMGLYSTPTYFWPAVNRGPTQLWPRHFLKWRYFFWLDSFFWGKFSSPITSRQPALPKMALWKHVWMEYCDFKVFARVLWQFMTKFAPLAFVFRCAMCKQGWYNWKRVDTPESGWIHLKVDIQCSVSYFL